jgi:hypothetical protein
VPHTGFIRRNHTSNPRLANSILRAGKSVKKSLCVPLSPEKQELEYRLPLVRSSAKSKETEAIRQASTQALESIRGGFRSGACARSSDRRSGRRSGRRARREGSSESNSSNFHEWGAAPPENFIGGFIRVHSENSWFRFVALGQASGTGSFTFPSDQEV